jgi:hypothetical protein
MTSLKSWFMPLRGSLGAMSLIQFVESENNDIPRRRYRKLTEDLFDPDTDSDPDADKPGMVRFMIASTFEIRTWYEKSFFGF